MGITDRLIVRWNKWKFERAVRSIEGTPPIAPGDSNFIVLSMVHKRDVLAYLLALKTFCRWTRPARVVLVADPSLGDEDFSVIRRHATHVEIHRAHEFQRDGIPIGGTWERLSAISDFVSEGYVVQLDADTVTLGPLPEVDEAVRAGRAFTLATDDDFPETMTLEAISAWAQPRVDPGAHVQLQAEALMNRLQGAETLRYARGCSGFAGFPRRSFDFARLSGLSRDFERLMGARWRDWGSEQVTSNVLTASLPGGHLLPHRTYCAPHRSTLQTRFLHFIGYVRFSSGRYAQVARTCAGELAHSIRADAPVAR